MSHEHSIESRLHDVEQQLMRIVSHLESESALARRDINRLEKQLFGNGQPGTIATMSERIVKLERLANYVVGALSLIAGSMAVILYAMDHWR